MARLKVVIDRAACCGYGICVDLCPRLFGLSDDGLVEVRQPFTDDDDLEAREAGSSCPQGAIVLEPA